MPIDSARIAHIILHEGVTFGLGYDEVDAARREYLDRRKQEAYDLGRALARGGWSK